MKQAVAAFDPFKDNAADFLSDLREHYDESYGKWHQSHLEDEGVIELDLRTGGWSDNEEVVDALLLNTLIRTLCYTAWERGGKHVFQFPYKP